MSAGQRGNKTKNPTEKRPESHKLKIMKKQILILTIFTLALIASTSTIKAQNLSPGRVIDPLSCITSSLPLHPYAGVEYTYELIGDAGVTHALDYTWWATKDPAFIPSGGNNNMAGRLQVGAGELSGVSANYAILTAATVADADQVKITWTPQILANTLYQGAASTTVFPSPTFVVGYAHGDNCADNIQVFEINPQVNFTIDIANIGGTGVTMPWDLDTTQCVDIVRLATYNSTSDQLDMDYGTNTLYFEVAGANFLNNFTPTFHLVSGLLGAQTAVITLHDTYAHATAGSNIRATANWTSATVGSDWATGFQFTAASPADVVDGVSFFVKVVISNLTYESIILNPFVLAVDAQDNYNSTTSTYDGIWDMEDADCTNVTDAIDQIDRATHHITPRPQLDMNGGVMGEPSTVDPENVIIKTP